MAEPALGVILEMIFTLVSNSASTIQSLFGLFLNLLNSLSIVSSSGLWGFILAALILGIVLFFLAKFFSNSVKIVLILLVLGLIILWILVVA